MTPEDQQRLWMMRAAEELQRLTDIIEGNHPKAQLKAPHGQTSNRPRALLEEYARLMDSR